MFVQLHKINIFGLIDLIPLLANMMCALRICISGLAWEWLYLTTGSKMTLSESEQNILFHFSSFALPIS